MAFNLQELERALFFARLKVNRANRHRTEAEHWWAEYLKTDFCRLVEERDPESGSQFFRVVSDQLLPPNLVLAIGDSLHNLSSAADYISAGIIRAATGKPSDKYFPTDETREGLRNSMKGPRSRHFGKPGSKKGAGNYAVVKAWPAFGLALLTHIKPYRGGGRFIWEIRKSDNIDKHELIVPTVAVTRLSDILLVDEKHDNTVHIGAASVGAGGVLNLMRTGQEFAIKSHGQASASITFPEGAKVFAGDPVFPTLIQCTQAISELIGFVEQLMHQHPPREIAGDATATA